ncbi:MAG TPA: carbonic anhydrase [Candidatus Omnitrophota bacterium]|nr:carbonic anhydrase [Candidatus Omnitrophota bacterium]
METRATCLNCMDGRVQLPVLTWIKANYPVDFVDVITEAGMDAVLAEQEDISEVLRSVKVSVDRNKSTRLFVVGHYDCRGNPVDEKRQRQQIINAVKRLKPLWPSQEVFGLWVNDQWQVEQLNFLP